MEHIAVDSSMLASIGHDAATNTLQALFKKGGLYEYSDVSAEEFTDVLQPGHEHGLSVGKAFGAIIQKRKAGRKIEGKIDTPMPREGKAPEAKVAEGRTVQRAGLAEESAAAPQPKIDSPSPLPAEAQAVSMKSTELTVHASEIQVTDPASQTAASELLLSIAAIRSEIATTFKPMKDAAYRAHKTICDQERMLDEPLATAEKILKGRITSFVEEQKRLARELEEANRRAEQERANAEAAERTVELAIEQAVDLEARGNPEAAEAVLANPAPVAPRYVAPAPVAPAVARTQGVTFREDWDFRVTNINEVPREFLMLNEVAIRNVGKNTKGRAQIKGIEFFPKTVVGASRGARR